MLSGFFHGTKKLGSFGCVSLKIPCLIAQMEATVEATFWHYILAVPLLFLLGGLIHCMRGVFNVLPDRLNLFPGRPYANDMADIRFSSNFSFWDWIAGTEYDEDGYYELFSFKNLRLHWTWTVPTGLVLLVSYPEASRIYAAAVNGAGVWFWDLVIFRLQNVTLM